LFDLGITRTVLLETAPWKIKLKSMSEEKKTALEFCVTDIKGAQVAREQGADRIELCIDLKVGGLSPSYGLIESCANLIETHVLIRPRAGNFHYQEAEIKLMISDIAAARKAGASGVVFGCLTEDGKIDVPANKRMLDACSAKGLFPSFHRAFDRCKADELIALETLITLGFKRVLTSGRASRAIDGIAALGRWNKQYGHQIEIMAGGGVEPENARQLLAMGIGALHCSIHQKERTTTKPLGEKVVYDLNKAAQMKAIMLTID
jgi:copper homeostasis protein